MIGRTAAVSGTAELLRLYDCAQPVTLPELAPEGGRSIAKRCRWPGTLAQLRPYFRYRKGITMIRSELLQALAADNPDLRPEEVEQVVDTFFDEISTRLAEGGRVELRGFGTFSTRQRDARTGRNPRTGSSVEVPSKRVPYFKPGKEMRARLNTD